MRSEFKGGALPIITEFNEWLRIADFMLNYRAVLNVRGWESAGSTQGVKQFSYKHINNATGDWILTLCSVFVAPRGTTISSSYRPVIGSIQDDFGAAVAFSSTPSTTHSQTTFELNIRGQGELDVIVIQKPYTISTTAPKDIYVFWHPVHDGSAFVDPQTTFYHSSVAFNHKTTPESLTGNSNGIDATNVNKLMEVCFTDQFFSVSTSVGASIVVDSRFRGFVSGAKPSSLIALSGAELNAYTTYTMRS
jgi:hypothetical protein